VVVRFLSFTSQSDIVRRKVFSVRVLQEYTGGEKIMAIFENLKVVDVSQVAAVPMTARIMADFGADVIHVENPETGDMFRHILEGLRVGIQTDFNYVFEHYNRNKRSMTLDLTNEKAQKILHRLLESADVFTTNLRPYELERYHLEYETVKEINPRIIAAYLTGLGEKGKERNTPAYDHTAYWARGGIPHRIRATTPPLQNPKIAAPAFINSFGDHVACLSLLSGVFLALYDREKTGQGRKVTASLLQSAVHQLSWDLAAALNTGEDYPIMDIEEVNVNPLVGQYLTKDNRWLIFCAVHTERYLPPFMKVMGLGELLDDPRFEIIDGEIQNHQILREIMRERFLTKTLDEWKILFNTERIPYSPEQTLLEVINDPQAKANGFFEKYEHPDHGEVGAIANPINVGAGEKTIRTAAPEFGQHTEEVLLEIGYNWEDIDKFRDEGLIA
jgi:crotonobetainyl-CoA:carnitine CoA-transferase CaiB-like acyl-CoA transferase